MIRSRRARTQRRSLLNQRSRFSRRPLALEVLEGRRLLVVGVMTPVAPPQNFGNPEDVNYDNRVTPLDALIIINRLNDPNRTDSPSAVSVDPDGDGTTSPRDALLIINRLNSGSDRSSVPPEQRAKGLRQALDAGQVPPNMTLSEAEELLETLEKGGYYEAGDRYRNGQMLNINDPESESDETLTAAEGEQTETLSEIEDPDADTGKVAADPVPLHEDEDPFGLFTLASDTLVSDLGEAAQLRSTLEVDVATGETSVTYSFQELFERIADRASSVDTREHLVQAIADAITNGDKSVDEIVDDLRTLQAKLGNAHAQISQMFANLDVAAIIDRLGVDLGTLASAILAHEQTGSSERDAFFAEFLGREYLDALGISLP